MATGESSAASTAAKLEEVLKAVRDVETKVDNKLSEMKREMESPSRQEDSPGEKADFQEEGSRKAIPLQRTGPG